ncbi:type IX secretion system membrane protein PorP/SprF [Flavobacterium sp. LAR06]|uniref:type IX secretion system membrane protein PorP/SprF n=1 Tax=Flavobacterium sp. LAR06 TaxID=3064897 RepID=UPI0035C16F52
MQIRAIGAPISVDFNTMLEIDNIFEIGGTYRIDNACAGIAGITIFKLLKVVYAFEANFKDELAKARNTNEFFLQFKI